MIIRKQYNPEALRLDFKAAGGPGSFSGYGAVFGNQDRDTEVIAKGAFADSLPAFIRDGFIAEAHEWECGVATVTTAREDDYGLYLEAQFHTDDESQACRTRTMERIERGKSVGLSVGFMPLEWTFDEQSGVRTITKAELYEVSIVTVPANPLAQVVSAKGWDGGGLPATERQFEKFLRDAGFSRSQSVAITSKGFAASLREAEESNPETPGNGQYQPGGEEGESIVLAESLELYSQAVALGVAA